MSTNFFTDCTSQTSLASLTDSFIVTFQNHANFDPECKHGKHKTAFRARKVMGLLRHGPIGGNVWYPTKVRSDPRQDSWDLWEMSWNPRWESLGCSTGSEIIGSAELRKREPAPPNVRVPFTIASSPLSENLEQAREGLDPKEGRWDPCWVCWKPVVV